MPLLFLRIKEHVDGKEEIVSVSSNFDTYQIANLETDVNEATEVVKGILNVQTVPEDFLTFQYDVLWMQSAGLARARVTATSSAMRSNHFIQALAADNDVAICAHAI